MELREELARQSLLLEFIADCVRLGTVGEVAKLIISRLHWICDLDACSVILPDAGVKTLWSMDRLAPAPDQIADPALSEKHRELLDRALARHAPILGDGAGTGPRLVALSLGSNDRALGALCLSRATKNFSQGDLRHLQHACSALGGALTRIAAVAAEREAEQAMKVAELQLRSVAEDRALLAEQMIGIVSHDLRNPLSAILVGASVMAMGEPLPPNKDRVLRNVEAAAKRARRLVEELLDFTQARVGSGLALRIEPVDLDRLMAASVQELRLTFPAIDLVYSGERLGMAELDADRLQQALGNLVANADRRVTHTAGLQDFRPAFRIVGSQRRSTGIERATGDLVRPDGPRNQSNRRNPGRWTRAIHRARDRGGTRGLSRCHLGHEGRHALQRAPPEDAPAHSGHRKQVADRPLLAEAV